MTINKAMALYACGILRRETWPHERPELSFRRDCLHDHPCRARSAVPGEVADL